MIRLKYVPDGLVYINDIYTATFEEFKKDCESLNENMPLEEGKYLLYTTPRAPKDRDRGIEYIDVEGMHQVGDNVLNDSMENIILRVNQFQTQKQIREKNDSYPATVEEYRIQKIAETKAEAGRRIVIIYPEWKQRNMMAASLEIMSKENKSYNDIQDGVQGATRYIPTAEEKVIMNESTTAKAAVDAIRSKSDEIEVLINNMDYDTLKAYNVTDNTNWI